MMNESLWHTFSIRLKRESIPWDLFTVLEVDWTAGIVQRSYSSDEVNYPSGGTKQLMKSDWAAHVILGQRAFVSRDQASFRTAFFDFELLESMGLHVALNVPVVEQERTVRTLNFLRAAPAFNAREQASIEASLAELGQ